MSPSVAPRDSKIDDPRPADLVDEDVSGFQIAMDDSTLMAMSDGITNWQEQPQSIPRAQVLLSSILSNRLCPIDVLHGEPRNVDTRVRVGCQHSRLEDLRNVGMLQSSEHARFVSKPLNHIGRRQPHAHHFQRHRPLGLILLREIHGPHTTGRQCSLDLIMSDATADHGWCRTNWRLP